MYFNIKIYIWIKIIFLDIKLGLSSSLWSRSAYSVGRSPSRGGRGKGHREKRRVLIDHYASGQGRRRLAPLSGGVPRSLLS
jgi:hypothetical protein